MRRAPVKKSYSGESTAMPIKYDELMALKNFGQKYAYTDREVMLYAYGIGMGADPMDEKELAFIYESGATPRVLKVSTTFPPGRGRGGAARRNESQSRDGGRRRARHHLPQVSRYRRAYHRRFQRA